MMVFRDFEGAHVSKPVVSAANRDGKAVWGIPSIASVMLGRVHQVELASCDSKEFRQYSGRIARAVISGDTKAGI